MAINFPDSPTNGQSATLGGNTWTYNSTTGAWARAAAAGSGVTVHADQTAMLNDAGSSDEGTLHYETDTNKLYVKQASGFYLLASITNASPTINSFSENTGGAGANNLTSGGAFSLTSGSNTVITINATDPDVGQTLTYSATVTGGTVTDVFTSPSFPVTNQSSNVFTLTPVTSGIGGTVTIRFDASDGTNIANVSHSFEIAFSIANSRYTTLLATAIDTSDNNDITDSSTNNHTITVNGDAQAGTFSPYRHGGYSVYLPAVGGTSEHNISFAHDESFNLGSNDFTIEFSIYFPSNSTGTDYLFQHGEAAGSWNINTYNGYIFFFMNGLSIGQDIMGDSGYTISSHTNEWIDYAIVRSGDTVTMYRNGTSVASRTSAQNANVGATLDISAPLHINRRIAGTGNGTEFYFKDFRVTKGLARSISAKINPLTSDANTSILVGGLPYIGDASSNNHTATFIGTPSTKPFTPYDNAEYSATAHGGSVYFDGTGDYLEVANSTDFDLGSTWTIKGWIYPDAINTSIQYNLISNQGSPNRGFWIGLQYGSGWRLRVGIYNSSGGWAEIAGTGGSITADAWNYIEVNYASGTCTIKVNGIQDTSGSIHQTGATTQSLIVGSGRDGSDSIYYNFKGYFSDLQIVNGSTAPESSVPSTLMSTDINSKLHIKGTDASIIDKSQRSNLQLTGAVGTTTSVNFAGTKSIDFSTISNDYYIKIPSKNQGGPGFPNLFAAPCTIECWINPTHVQANGLAHKVVWYVGDGNAYILFQQENTDNLRLRVRFGSTTYFNEETLNSYKLAANTWQHVCFMSNAGATSCSLYLNGTRVMSGNLSNGLLDPSADNVYFSFGSSGPGTPWAGYASDIKISTYNVYGSPSDTTITPPTVPLEG